MRGLRLARIVSTLYMLSYFSIQSTLLPPPPEVISIRRFTQLLSLISIMNHTPTLRMATTSDHPLCPACDLADCHCSRSRWRKVQNLVSACICCGWWLEVEVRRCRSPMSVVWEDRGILVGAPEDTPPRSRLAYTEPWHPKNMCSQSCNKAHA